MSLETWMHTRKIILLAEKKERLFTQLPNAEDYRATRIELYDTLSRMAEYKRESEPVAAPALEIPMIA